MLIRFSLAMFASLLTCATLLAADEPTAKKDEGTKPSAENTTSSLSDEVAAINKEMIDLNRRYQTAFMALQMSQKTSKEKLLELINANPDDPAVVDAVLVLVEKLRTPLDNELMGKVSKSLMSNAKSGELCLKLTRPNPQMAGQENLLKQIAEKHEKEEARGLANFALGVYCCNLAQASQDNDAKQAEHLANAEKYLTKVKNEFASVASVPYYQSTVGKTTERELKRARNMPNIKIGKMAPEIDAVDMDGKPAKLSDSRGKLTMLVFWGAWCGPCMAMVPHEKELYEKMQGKPFSIVSVNCRDKMERAQETRKSKDMAWTCWWDGDGTEGAIRETYNVPHYPYILLIDAKGVIRHIYDNRGPKSLDAAIEKLMAEMDSNKVSQQ